MTIRTTTTVRPRQGRCGIGRSYSSETISDGLAKNNLGSRSWRLELEIDEGITVSLSENDGASHCCPHTRDTPTRDALHGCFDVRVAQRPVRDHHEESDDADLEHFTRTKNRVGMRVTAEHAAQHSRSDGEIRRAKENPRQTNRGVRCQAKQDLHGKIFRP